MTLRLLALAFAALSALAACGGKDDFLFDDEPEATGTPAFFQRSPEASPEPTPSGSPVGEGTPGACGPAYTVQAGDVMFNIAQKCGVSLADLQKANPKVTPTALRVGQALVIPP